jgi:hypothetical protein
MKKKKTREQMKMWSLKPQLHKSNKVAGLLKINIDAGKAKAMIKMQMEAKLMQACTAKNSLNSALRLFPVSSLHAAKRQNSPLDVKS